VLAGALTQARDARLHILDVMAEAIDRPDEMSPYAPRVISVKVPVDKIGEVIGPKGKMINQIQDDTGADISIEDDGTVYIGATDGPSAEAARAAINAIANPHDARGRRALPGHRREDDDVRRVRLAAARQGRPAAHLRGAQARRRQADRQRRRRLSVGQKVQVELKEIDPRGKLSLAAVLAEGETGDEQAPAADSAPAAAPAADADTDTETDEGDAPAGDGEREERGERRPRNRRRGGNRGRGERSESEGATTDA
jgi:polyribonucleotide nucleotidyltransferase